jgi:hypothetical protein
VLQRVIIVKKLRYIYYLLTPAANHDQTLTLKMYADLGDIELNTPYSLGTGTTAESISFTGRTNNVFNLATQLTKNHPVTDGVILPIGGLSGNPIIVEEAATDEHLSWVIGHELGHSLLQFANLDDVTNLMNWFDSVTDHKLRFKNIQKHNEPGKVESQWQLLDPYRF